MNYYQKPQFNISEFVLDFIIQERGLYPCGVMVVSMSFDSRKVANRHMPVNLECVVTNYRYKGKAFVCTKSSDFNKCSITDFNVRHRAATIVNPHLYVSIGLRSRFPDVNCFHKKMRFRSQLRCTKLPFAYRVRCDCDQDGGTPQREQRK